MIAFENLTKKFGRIYALEGVSCALHTGQVVSLLGPNGSGKTTLIKIILGLVLPDKGKLFYDGNEVHKHHLLRKQLGYMPQFGKFPENLKVAEVIQLIEKMRPHNENEKDTDLYNSFGIAQMKDKRIKALSGGMKQKLSAHLAFLFSPPVLVLDEPTAGLDPLSAEILKEKIINEKQKGKTILISNHIMPEVEETATHIMYLKEGRMMFFEDKGILKESTGEERLAKAIAKKIA